MKHKIFMVYDDKAKAYLPPFFLPEMGQATRAFADCVNDPGHQFGKHPEDYTLFCAGIFDDRAGTLAVEPSLVCVAHGVELRARLEDSPAVPVALKVNGVDRQAVQE